MQLTKNNHYEDNSLFADQLLLHDPPTPHSHPFSSNKPNHKPQSNSEEQAHHSESPHLLQPSENNELRFFQEYKKIYTVAHHLALQKKRQFALWEGLNKRIRALEEKMKDTQERKNPQKRQNSEENKIKRARRTAQQIQKKFKCEVPYCQRLYGSEGSLQQHIKLKHPELYHRSQSESSMLRQGDISF